MQISAAIIAPAILFLVFWLFVWRNWDKKQREPLHALIIAAGFGMLGAWLMVSFGKTELYSLMQSNLKSGIILTAILAIGEELIKLFGFIAGAYIYRRYFDQLVDALVYGASTALGFAFIENIIYFRNFPSSVGLVIFRSLDSMFAHALFTGIFCFYFALAFSPMKIGKRKIPIVKKQRHTAATVLKDFFLALTFHVTRRHILPHRASTHGHRSTEIIFEGFWFSVLAHFLHNIFVAYKLGGRTLAFLIPILIVFLAIFTFALFKQPWYIRIAEKERKRIT
ncbi:PrsW family intramembrane metalloprotease [Candidatus Peregrinibacteria bacterium]|nr:PrsW family intramembrane metalloprotease [Candidatus Peregrinibacteria bacterium]